MEVLNLISKKFMLMAIFLVSLLAVSAVSANDLNATDEVAIDDEDLMIEETSDGPSQDDVLGVKDDGTFTALKNKIDNALSGSTLILENDYAFNADTDYELSPWGSYDEITPSIYNKDLTIEGKGHTIDANHLNSILSVGGQSNVVLKNINFKNGYYYDSSNGVSTSAVRAGGYYNYEVSLSVVGCSFENCYNSQSGGAVTFDSGGHGSLTDCSFLNCSSQMGGAIYKEKNVVDCIDVVGCSFIDCSSINYGGAIYEADNVVGCNFTHCFGIGDANWGAAIYGGSVVSNCNFINCSNNNVGGAIYDADEVIDCNFKQCTSRNGAAIRSAQNVKCCSFIDCSSPITEEYTSVGGAIDDAVNVVNCYFRNCSARKGGAIYDANNVDGCIFIGCSADEGGAIYEPRNVTNSNFTNNVADKGGAMYIDYYYNPIITNCNFKDSSKNGQLFFYRYLTYYCDSYSRCTLSNLNFESNELNYAGGISFANNVLTVVGDKQYMPSNAGNNIDLSKLVYLSGDVTVNIAGKTFKTALDSGIAKFDLNTIADGTYDATILYSGCDVAPPLEIKIPLTIKSNIRIQANNLVKYYGGSEKYTVTVTNGNVKLSGVNVNFNVNGKTSTAKTDVKGQATIPLDLPVGTYDVVSNYNGASATSKVTVKSTLTASDASGTYLNSKVSATFLNVDGNALASKQVTFKVGDKTYTATTNSNGVASANIPLGVGTYTVTAVNPANNEEKQFKLTISKASSTTRLTAVQNGKSVTLTAALTPNAATGKVTFEINGKTKEASISNGKASATFSDLSANTYPAKATYSGDSNLKSSSASASVKVDDVHSITNVGDTKGTYLNSKVSATFLDANGKALANTKVIFRTAGKTFSATTNSNGAATAKVDLDAGDYNVVAVNPATKEEKQFKLTIDKATPEFTLKAGKSDLPITADGKPVVTITATFSPNTVTGKVTVSSEGSLSYYVTITNGQAVVTTFYASNVAYDVIVSYSGDNNFKAVEKAYSFNVSNAKPVLTAESISFVYGNNKNLVVNVKDADGTPIANRDVYLNIFIGNNLYNSYSGQSDENGQLKFSAKGLKPNTYMVYINSDDCKEITAKITVKKATPKITAKAKTFKKSDKTKKYTVTLKNNKKLVNGVTVKITVNKKTYSAKTNNKGVATFKLTKLTKKGKFAATVKSVGNKYYNAKTLKNVKITVK